VANRDADEVDTVFGIITIKYYFSRAGSRTASRTLPGRRRV